MTTEDHDAANYIHAPNERRGADGPRAPLSDERDVQAATAANQTEFPYDRGGEASVTRREFCNFLGITSGALFVAAAGFAAKSTVDARRKPASQAAKIEGADRMLPGTSLNFRYPTERDTAILVRAASGEYYAFGQKCTHLSCPVYYDRTANRLSCPCHLGAYDARTGSVLFGPPPRALDQIALELRANGEVWATGRRSGGNEHIV